MGLKGAPSARVAIPQGDIYPSGIPTVPPNAVVQSTVRPEGNFFMSSLGYRTIRPGAHRYQDAFKGPGIGFSPLRYAEDISNPDSLPVLIDQDDALAHADIADIPGSEYLDSDGNISIGDGVYMGRSDKSTPMHDGISPMHAHLHSVPDMGDREADRPLTRNWLNAVLKNPLSAFKDEYATHPVTAVAVAASGITLAYWIGKEFETQYNRRGNNPAAAAPAAVATSGEGTDKASHVVGDVIKEAGDAINKAADTVASAV